MGSPAFGAFFSVVFAVSGLFYQLKHGRPELSVRLDAMGTPKRSKSFHETYYGNMGDNGLPDQITTIQAQLITAGDFFDTKRASISVVQLVQTAN